MPINTAGIHSHHISLRHHKGQFAVSFLSLREENLYAGLISFLSLKLSRPEENSNSVSGRTIISHENLIRLTYLAERLTSHQEA